MLARSILAAFAVMALPAATVAQGFEYAPGTAQYRITLVTKTTQDAMGQKQDFESESRMTSRKMLHHRH